MNARRHISGWRQPLLWGVGLAVLLTVGLAASQEQKSATQASMRGIYVTVSNAYIYSLNPEAFEAPENRQKILILLEALDANASQFDAHSVDLDPSFDYLKRSLARDANDALLRFKMQNYVGSRFVLSKITENCVTCHTKLPSREPFDLGAKFVEDADVQSLSPYSLATLQAATRQFDAALDTYEEILKSPDIRPGDLALYDVFENYFRIAIGALSDVDRPLNTLSEFAKRPDLPESLRKDTESWIAELDGLTLDELDSEQLEAAQAMLESAQAKTDSKSDRSQLVDFVASITLLHRYLRTGPQADEDIARAYYLLGVAESYVAQSYWISEVDFLLEKAIRQAPQSESARQALAFLEDYTYSEYRVTPARAVPEELEINLEELRELVANDQ